MSMIREFQLALNSLSRVKGYSAAIILTLGITLGALVAIFMVNYQLLSAPLPYDNQDRLFISKGSSFRDSEIKLSDTSPYPALIDAYSFKDTDFEKKALINFNVDVIRNFPASPRVNLSYITPEYLDMIQTPFALGRNFNAQEGLGAKAPVAVISYEAWDKLFNKRQDTIGQTLRFGEVNFKIIGVTAKNFVEPELVSVGRLTDVWLAWDFNLTEEGWRHSWGDNYRTITLSDC
ncbi:ABC transporter permease [Pseudoalteromonas maricaloris]